MAAKQSIHLATGQGAFLTIEGGNLTFGCPGKLMVQAGNHKLVGAAQLSPKLPIFPDNVCIECLMKRAAQRSGFINKGA